MGCYIDGGRALFENGGLSDNIWVDGFECCADIAGVDHGIILSGAPVGPGLQITHNRFGGGSIYYASASESLENLKVAGVRIEDNAFTSTPRASRATRSLYQQNATQWSFDFCDVLIFPTIVSAHASLQADYGFATVVTRPANGCKVLAETDKAISGTVTIEVDTSALDPGFM